MSTCANILSNADVEFWIAPTAQLPDENTQVAWASVTGWIEVKGLSAIGARGPKRPAVSFKPLKGNICVSPGLTDFGTMTFTAADLPEDAGQRLIIDTALMSKAAFPMKVVHKDATTTLTVPTTEYFAGPVMSFSQDQISDPDSNRTRSGEAAINQYLEAQRCIDAPTITTPIETDGIIDGTEDDTVVIAGTSLASATIDVSVSDGVNAVVTAQVTADGAGAWTLAGGDEMDLSGLDAGTLIISATQTDGSGHVSWPAVTTVTHTL